MYASARPGGGSPGRRAWPALALLAIRLALVAVATVVAWLVVSGWGASVTFPPDPMLAALSLLPVNVLSIFLVGELLRSDGQTIRDLLGIRPGKVLADIGWGLLWMVVLSVPFALAVTGTVWLLYGDRSIAAFETIFYNPESTLIVDPVITLVLGIVAFVTFAPLNAPAEELVYRGYAQSRLTAAWPAGLAIVLPAVVFGVQHAFFAPTQAAMLVYVVAFTVWGLGAALIVRRQGRLLPVVIAHFIINLGTSTPALVFPILLISGAI